MGYYWIEMLPRFACETRPVYRPCRESFDGKWRLRSVLMCSLLACCVGVTLVMVRVEGGWVEASVCVGGRGGTVSFT